jgi:hypothetical protein
MADAQSIERHFGRPPVAELKPATRGTLRECDKTPRSRRSEHDSHPPRGCTQKRDGQCVIIAAQDPSGNGE